MSLLLVDTNIVSYLYKQDSRAKLYEPHLLGHEISIALMTVAELLQWAAFRNWGLPRVQLLRQPSMPNILSCQSILTHAVGGRPFARNAQQPDFPSLHKMPG